MLFRFQHRVARHEVLLLQNAFVLILALFNVAHTFTPRFFNIHFNIVVPSIPGAPNRSFSFKFTDRNCVCVSSLNVAHYHAVVTRHGVWIDC
jgi:hypothetical protein